MGSGAHIESPGLGRHKGENMDQTQQVEAERQHLQFAQAYLWPALEKRIVQAFGSSTKGLRALDLGCRFGATSDHLRRMGLEVVGVDPSQQNIARARASYAGCTFETATSSDDLAGRFGHFDLVTSLEFIEHVYDPVTLSRRVHELLKPGAPFVLSTPYHGYVKNAVLALSGRLDSHFTALSVGGRIKFWSVATLTRLLTQGGFENVEIDRLGRLPPIAKSMMAVARKAL